MTGRARPSRRALHAHENRAPTVCVGIDMEHLCSSMIIGMHVVAASLNVASLLKLPTSDLAEYFEEDLLDVQNKAHVAANR